MHVSPPSLIAANAAWSGVEPIEPPMENYLMPRSQSPKLLPYIALGTGVISLGFSGIFVRWANAPGPVSSFYRMLIALLAMTLPFIWQLKNNRKPLPKSSVWIAFVGGIVFAADIAFWATGVMLSGATNPTLLANTAPLWVGLGALFLFKEKLNLRFWIGLFLAMAGAVIVLGLDSIRTVSLGLGSLFGLLAGLFYGGYILITQRGRESLDSLSYFWFSSVGSAVALWLITIVLRQPLTGYPSNSYLSFLGAGLISQALGYISINYALGHLPGTLVSPTLLGQPVLTAILAVPLLGEQLHILQVVGGAAVLLGVYVVHGSRSTPAT
jgi:drug/metabolite transporter (DMT)-like permease